MRRWDFESIGAHLLLLEQVDTNVNLCNRIFWETYTTLINIRTSLREKGEWYLPKDRILTNETIISQIHQQFLIRRKDTPLGVKMLMQRKVSRGISHTVRYM